MAVEIFQKEKISRGRKNGGRKGISSAQGCGSGYFSNASASASASTPIASASTNKKRKNER